MGILLSDVFDSRAIILNLQSKTKEEVFAELSNAIADVHPECAREDMIHALWEREDKLSTGIASGVAIPHAMCRGLGKTVGAIGVAQAGIEYYALDQKPVDVIFMLILREPADENHLRILNQIFKLAQSEALALVRKAESVQEICAVLSRFYTQ